MKSNTLTTFIELSLAFERFVEGDPTSANPEVYVLLNLDVLMPSSMISFSISSQLSIVSWISSTSELGKLSNHPGNSSEDTTGNLGGTGKGNKLRLLIWANFKSWGGNLADALLENEGSRQFSVFKIIVWSLLQLNLRNSR